MHQLGAEFPLPFSLVPWRHHIEIITKCKSIDEALFYIGKTIEQGLSREALINGIKANLYEHQGKIANNFSEHLPALQSKLVQEVLKENYDFGFATVKHEIFAVDELMSAPDDNPTIDLLICSDMNKTKVQWSFKGIGTPMGVATYNNIRIKDMLPTKEQLKARMELLQKEMRKTKMLMNKNK